MPRRAGEAISSGMIEFRLGDGSFSTSPVRKNLLYTGYNQLPSIHELARSKRIPLESSPQITCKSVQIRLPVDVIPGRQKRIVGRIQSGNSLLET
jgi:hypothetical protein